MYYPGYDIISKRLGITYGPMIFDGKNHWIELKMEHALEGWEDPNEPSYQMFTPLY